jgi:Sulfotransferase family
VSEVAPAASDPIRALDGPGVLYIMGTARSGSTVLHILLSALPGVAGGGELAHAPRDAFLLDHHCSCGQRASSCSVWRGVRARCAWSEPELRRVARIMRTMDGNRGFFATWLGLRSSRSEAEYREANHRLIAAAAAELGAPIVVDSSKYAGRALLLSKLWPARVRVVLLTRSAQGVMGAFERGVPGGRPPSSLSFGVLYYGLVTLYLRLAKARLGSSCVTVTYEELMSDPGATVDRIGRWIGRDGSELRERIDQHRAFPVGHIVTGNQLRLLGTGVRIDPTHNRTDVAGRVRRALCGPLELWRRFLGLAKP